MLHKRHKLLFKKGPKSQRSSKIYKIKKLIMVPQSFWIRCSLTGCENFIARPWIIFLFEWTIAFKVIFFDQKTRNQFPYKKYQVLYRVSFQDISEGAWHSRKQALEYQTQKPFSIAIMYGLLKRNSNRISVIDLNLVSRSRRIRSPRVILY